MKANDIIKFTNENGTTWIAIQNGEAEKFVELVNNVNKAQGNNAPKSKIFKAGQVALEELPEETQQEVRDTLRAFDECYVEYFNNQWYVSTCIVLLAKYPRDQFTAGTYKAKEVYTKEQRRQNFIEEFGYAPCF